MSAVSVRVLFFASLREAVGVGSADVTLASGRFDELKDSLSERLGAAGDVLWEDNVRLAVNQTLLETTDVGFASQVAFADGDEVAFLPPVTGG